MSEWVKAVLFGLVEGITEWLPISSTGHLILLNEVIRLEVSEEFYRMFELVVKFLEGNFSVFVGAARCAGGRKGEEKPASA